MNDFASNARAAAGAPTVPPAATDSVRSQRTPLRTVAGRVCGIVLAASAAGASADALKLPPGAAVLLDGRCEAAEYTAALRRTLSDKVELLAQHRDGLIALCLRYTPPQANGVDLFIADADGTLYNLHASASLGERRRSATHWPEWTWWNNTGWSANPVRPRNFRELAFEPSDATEFVIRRERFRLPWRLRIDVHTRVPGVIWPAGSSADDARDWVGVDL